MPIVLKDFQAEGVKKMHEIEKTHSIGGLLSFQLGLGKSITMTVFLLERKKIENPTIPDLIIVPLAVLLQWKSEIHKVDDTQKVHIYHGRNRVDELKKLGYKNFDFIICTYYPLITGELEEYEWQRVVIDESHILRNGYTMNHRSIPKKVIGAYNLIPKSKFRWCITGTPYNNRKEDILPLMTFVGYKDIEISHINNFIEKFVLQKSKDGIMKPIITQDIPIDRPLEGMEMYNETYKKYGRLIGRLSHCNPLEAKKLYKQAMNLLTQLRIFCNFMIFTTFKKFVVEKDEDEDDEDEREEIIINKKFSTEEKLEFYNSSPKIRIIYDKLIEILPKCPENRVIIFSTYITTLEVLEAILNKNSPTVKTFKYTGQMNKHQRDISISSFTKEDSSEFMVLFATIGAGNVGLNLVPCSTVFIADLPINPFELFQAVNRVHRITQKHEVNVFRFYMKDMIEDNILKTHGLKIKEAGSSGLLVDLKK